MFFYLFYFGRDSIFMQTRIFFHLLLLSLSACGYFTHGHFLTFNNKLPANAIIFVNVWSKARMKEREALARAELRHEMVACNLF